MKKASPIKLDFSKFPKPDFIKRLTTPTGIIQHTKYGVPERSQGYSLDDNARALIVAVKSYQLTKKKQWLEYAVVYLSFLTHAKREDSSFYNFQTFDHQFLPQISEDAFGEVVWALGVTINAHISKELTLASKSLFNQIKNKIAKIGSPRAKGYAILGLFELYEAGEDSKWCKRVIIKLGDDLIKLYEKSRHSDWYWFEHKLAYANHILPAALFYAYLSVWDKKFLQVAQESLDWLNEQTHTKEGFPSPVGSFGWYAKGERRAKFDQQPIEASYAILSNLAAFRAIKDKNYIHIALDWLSWFHGNNIKGVVVWDEKTGACYDGITKEGRNLNQGAESTICYFLAYLSLAQVLKEELVTDKPFH